MLAKQEIYGHPMDCLTENELINSWRESIRGKFVSRLKLDTFDKNEFIYDTSTKLYVRKLIIEIEMTNSEHIMYQLLPKLTNGV